MRNCLFAVAASVLIVVSGGIGVQAQDRVVDAHASGYIPVTVPAKVRIVANRLVWGDLRFNGFDIYITPNIVPEREAVSRAAYHAAAYCTERFGSRRVKLTAKVRHSGLDLESWAFRGYCRR